MKVLHVIPALGSGGAEKMLLDLTKEMKDSGISCEIAILTKKDNFFAQELYNLNIPIYFGGEKGIYKLKNILFLKRLIKKGKYDIIHTHLFSSQLFTPVAGILARIKVPLITTEHSTHNRRRDKRIFYPVDYWLYSKYKKIIAITDAAKANLNNYLPFTKKNSQVILNGVEITHYKNAVALSKDELIPGSIDSDKFIVMVASLRSEKDHETLIKASNYLPENYKIIFIGDGEKMDDLKIFALKNSRSQIYFLGKRKDVAEILKTSDLFVLSSNWEGFGLVVVEAAASGLPVVASNIEGLNSVVQEVGGALFEPRNEQDLAKKILKSMESNSMNYNKTEKFSISNTAKGYIKLYEEVLASSN